jgi:phosphate transport system permease protein
VSAEAGPPPIVQGYVADRPSIPPAPTGEKVRGILFQLLLLLCLLLAGLCLVALLIDVIGDGASSLSWDFLTSPPSAIPALAGLEPAIWGTVWLAGICVLFIIPVGVATAVYLEEYANPTQWFNRMVEVNIQNLAAVPSIVYGIFGLAFLYKDGLSFGPVVLTGGLTLGLLVLPVVIVTAREAIRAVPPSIREGAMALGATKWQAIWKQVLPGSVAGIATGTILALSRAVGETAPLLLVGAVTFISTNPDGLDSRYTAIPFQIFDWTSDSRTAFQQKAAAAIIVLMVLLIIMNSVAIWLRSRYQRKW